jgi:hypothetical protein
MRLFNRTILLVLSWVMLIAVLMSCFMGRVGIALLLLFPFGLLRVFSPGQTMFKKVVHESPESRRGSRDLQDAEQNWGSARPNTF